MTALFLSPAQAGDLLGVSAQSVRRMIRAGELRAESRGRNIKIPRAELERLAGTRLGPTEEEAARRELIKELRLTLAKAQDLLARLEM